MAHASQAARACGVSGDEQRENAHQGVHGVACGGGGKVGESFGNAHGRVSLSG